MFLYLGIQRMRMQLWADTRGEADAEGIESRFGEALDKVIYSDVGVGAYEEGDGDLEVFLRK